MCIYVMIIIKKVKKFGKSQVNTRKGLEEEREVEKVRGGKGSREMSSYYNFKTL